MRAAVVVPALAAAALFGCGMARLQGPRPVPPGHLQGSIGQFVAANQLLVERGPSLANFPFSVDLRLGVHERADVGLSLYLLSGALADVRVNLMPPEHDLAVSIRAGFGAGADPISEDDDWALHLPADLLAGWRLGGTLTPYLGLGYSFTWVFGRRITGDIGGGAPVPRDGWGDGLLRAAAGLSWTVSETIDLVLEYSYLHPVVDDRGDAYAFVPSHTAGIAVAVHGPVL